MDDSAILSHRRHTANTLYCALCGELPSRERLLRACEWFELRGMPFERQSFFAYIGRLKEELPAASPLATLRRRWAVRWRGNDGFSEEDAGHFLQDYLASLDPNLLFHAPVTAGYTRWRHSSLAGGFAFARQTEQAWSLLFCTEGGARLRAGGRDLGLRPGSVLLLQPGAVYTLRPARQDRPWGYHWAVFQPDGRWRAWLDWPVFAAHVAELRLPRRQRPALAAVFEQLANCLRENNGVTADLSRNLLEQLILRCRGCLPASMPARRDARIERARQFMAGHYAHALTVAEVARECNLSPSRLASLFRQQCGVSVLGYRDELRMVAAARLLRDSALPVADIGMRVGYADPAYFSRSFTAHVGMSPRQFRQQH